MENLHDFFDSVNGNLFKLAIVAYDPLFTLGGRPNGSNLINTFWWLPYAAVVKLVLQNWKWFEKGALRKKCKISSEFIFIQFYKVFWHVSSSTESLSASNVTNKYLTITQSLTHTYTLIRFNVPRKINAKERSKVLWKIEWNLNHQT